MGVIVASSTQTASGNSGALASTVRSVSQRTVGGIFLLNVTAAATAAGDTLDVYVQSSIDSGTTYDDFIHFTQVLGNGGAVKSRATWMSSILPTTPIAAPKDATLAVGVNQGPVGATWRVKWVIASASSPSFTFSVSYQPVFG